MRSECMDNSDKPTPKLSRSISLPWLVFYGVGTILGAGIFVVIGKVIGEAGALTPLAYLIAGVVAFATALSYAEVAARIPTAGGPIDYVERASGLKHLGSLAGWGLVAANTVSAATITSGFIGYLGVFIDLPDWLVAIGIIIALASLAAVGMKASTMFMAMTTIIGMVTLIAVVWSVRDGLAATPGMLVEELGSISSIAAIGLFGGTFLALYSFIGFGDMVLTAEEVKKVERTLPRAIVTAFAIVFVFYLLVSSAVVGAGPTDPIAEAEAPLVAVVERAGWPAWPVGIASLFIIVNGALTQIIGAARLLMDIGRDGRGVPGFFGRINHRTGTPVIATIAIGIIVMLLAVFVPLKQLAEATSLIILIVFAAVNLSLLALKAKSQPDGVPNMWIGVPIIGALTSVGAVATQIGFWVS